jgi:DNA repair exonuclease SbcCD ATPase subunit
LSRARGGYTPQGYRNPIPRIMLDLEQLKNLDLQRPTLEELVYVSALATGLHAEYDKLSVDVPEWLDNRARELKREIRTRQQDSVDKRVSEIKSRLDALKTPTEKRAELQAELDKLTATVSG